MRNLTQQFREALPNALLWRNRDFYEVMAVIFSTEFSLIFWEGQDNWAVIRDGETEVGYIWKKYPVIFVINEVAARITGSLKNRPYVAVVSTHDLSEKEFMMDEDSPDVMLVAGLDSGRFSAEEFCTATSEGV